MFAISVELLHGTFRGDPDGTAPTGRQEQGEWPPSPMRLFSALVAADGTGENSRVTDGSNSELHWLEALKPPVIYAAGDVPHHQQLCGRYVLGDDNSTQGSHHEYVARKGSLVRPGVRVAPRNPLVVYEWQDKPSEEDLQALWLRAARIGYLGASDSPVRVRVCSELPNDLPDGQYLPSADGDRFISVTAPGCLSILDNMYSQWCKLGPETDRKYFPALRKQKRYRSPGQTEVETEIEGRGKVVAWLKLETPVSGRRISAVTELFKAAVMSHYQKLYGEPPPLLHGHGFKERGYDLARYLALPDVGHLHARGRLHGLALWLPQGASPTEQARAADAAKSVRRLVGHGLDVGVQPKDCESKKPVAIQPETWQGKSPSTGWITAVPAIHERRGKLTLEEVARWCEHAGLPAPVDFRYSRTPFLPGALDLAPVEVNRPGKDGGPPYSHIALRFANPISGPVVIGGGRQRGFGLCVPSDDQKARQ